MFHLLKITQGKWPQAVRLLVFLAIIPMVSAISAVLLTFGGPVVHPKVTRLAAPLVCSGTMIPAQENVTLPSGRNATDLQFYCQTGSERRLVTRALHGWMLLIFFLLFLIFYFLLATVLGWTLRPLLRKLSRPGGTA